VRRLRQIAVTSLAAGLWLGCNAILGNESAVYDPSVDGSGGEGSSDGSPADDGTAPPDADRDAGPCVDVTVNPRHCGACGHDCVGGSCAGGTCQPFPLTTEKGKIEALAVDATHLYWSNSASGDVKRVPIAGGAAEPVFDGPDGVSPGKQIGVHQGSVYFVSEVDDGSVLRCPVTGCAASGPEVVVPNLARPDFVTVVASASLLFGEFDTPNGRVGRCVLPCAGNVEFVAGSELFPIAGAAGGDTIAWSTLQPGFGSVRAKLGDAPPLTVEADVPAVAIAIAGEEIVYADRGRGPRVALRDGGSKRYLAPFSTQTESLVVDGNDVYFTDTAEPGRVLRCPLSGCGDAGKPMASAQARPRVIAVDGPSVYWVNEGGADAVIMRVAK
jgi:hypothetical protein